jgi:hypothetical protein
MIHKTATESSNITAFDALSLILTDSINHSSLLYIDFIAINKVIDSITKDIISTAYVKK